MAFYALAMATHRRRSSTAPASGRRPTSCSSSSSTSPTIRQAMDTSGVWDDTDGLYYDKLVTPDGTAVPVKVRSMVGIIPLLAAVVARRASARPGRDAGQGVRPAARASSAAARASPSRGSLRGEPGARAPAARRRRRRPAASRLFAKLFDERRVPVAVRPAGACRPTTASTPTSSTSRASGDDRLRAGRVDDVDVRRQLQLARADLVPAQLPR